MESFWINDISELFNKDRLMDVWPKNYYSLEQRFNAISRMIIYLTILGYFATKKTSIVLTATIVLAILVFLYHNQSDKNKQIEGMDNAEFETEEEFKKTDFENIMKDKFTFPTKKNPMMNVLLPEIKYNKDRKKAAPSYNEAILRNLNKAAQHPELSNKLVDSKKLYRDLGDNLTFEHTMRNFHTMPNTKIPNEQRKFAEFCYGNMASCKDGDDVQCSKNLRRIGNSYF